MAMTPFHTLCPEIAQREVRCVHVLAAPGVASHGALSPGEYAYVEFYCDDLPTSLSR